MRTDKLAAQQVSEETCRNQILSDDYIDLIVEHSEVSGRDLARVAEEYCIEIINWRYLIAHLPAQENVSEILQRYHYTSIPKLLTLLDSSSMEASGITALQNQPVLNLRGRNIIIGFIDTGIDYLNDLFKNADNTSRIMAIWDQTIQEGQPPYGFRYGSEYNRTLINEALNSDSPYEIVPSKDENGHGTSLAAIAAGGEDFQNDFIGAAPDADIVVVKLKPAKQSLRDLFLIREDAVAYQENDIMTGVQYLRKVATDANKPLIICLGLGSNSGDHAGNLPLGNYLAETAIALGRAVVVAGGNEANAGHHFYGLIESDVEYLDVELRVGENERGFTLELWGVAPDIFSVAFRSPSGEYIPRIFPRNTSQEIGFVFESTKVYVDYRFVETAIGDQLIVMRFKDPTPGIWTIQVFGTNLVTGQFHMWLPVTGFISPDTYFLRSDPDTTLTMPANTTEVITVSAYNHKNNSIYLNSSRGYTRTGEIKPDLAAPGVDISVPAGAGGYVQQSGTSIAAAHVAGAAALMMNWSIERLPGETFNTNDIKKYLIRGANRISTISYPNREWGYGSLDLNNTFEVIRGPR
jgi:subtilisin family serine protease